MSLPNVPLGPGVRADIEARVADIEDDDVRQHVLKELLGQAQREANLAARRRGDFREAVNLARERGARDPFQTARHEVEQFWINEQYEARVRTTMARVADRNTLRGNKLATQQEKRSKSAHPSQRRFLQRDRQYVRIVGEAERAATLANTASVLSEINNKLTHYRLPHWEKTTLPLKVMALSLETVKHGGQTINLHLAPKTRAEALRSPRGAAAYLQDRIRKSFERTFGKGNVPDFWFVIEAGSGSGFHLHGAVVTPSSPPNAVTLVDAALRAAGGGWASSVGHHLQQVSHSLDDPLYWAAYATGDVNKTHLKLGHITLLALTTDIRRAAEDAWEGVRRDLPQSPPGGRPPAKRRRARTASPTPSDDVDVDVEALMTGGVVDDEGLDNIIDELAASTSDDLDLTGEGPA